MGAPYGREYYLKFNTQIEFDKVCSKLTNTFKRFYHLKDWNYSYLDNWKFINGTSSNTLEISSTYEDDLLYLIFVTVYRSEKKESINFLSLLDWNRASADFMNDKAQRIVKELKNEFRNSTILFGHQLSHNHNSVEHLFERLENEKHPELLGVDFYAIH